MLVNAFQEMGANAMTPNVQIVALLRMMAGKALLAVFIVV